MAIQVRKLKQYFAMALIVSARLIESRQRFGEVGMEQMKRRIKEEHDRPILLAFIGKRQIDLKILPGFGEVGLGVFVGKRHDFYPTSSKTRMLGTVSPYS